MRAYRTIDRRLAALEARAAVEEHDPQWQVWIETAGMPEAAAEALRAEAERLAMPAEPGCIRIVEVRCPSLGVDPDWAKRANRLQVYGARPHG